MPMWRCPHCGTPQAETARCWVCHRSTTACATCRHFRRSVAAQLGYCGLDRQRLPLRGNEIRACWESASTQPTANGPAAATERTAPVRGITFVEVRTDAAAGIASPEGAARLRPLEPVRHVDLGRPAPNDAIGRTPVRRLEFVEVTSTRPAEPDGGVPGRRRAARTRRRPAAVGAVAGDGPPAESVRPAANSQEPAAAEPRWSLWGELDA
jgi:hypothetical protein